MRRFFLILLMVAFCSVSSALAAEPATKANPAPNKTVTAPENKPIKITERNTPIFVEFEGTDSLGSRLSTRIKEVFNASNLFSLTDKDIPKLRVLISSTPEFPTRPGVGSAYAVVWTFSQSESKLRWYLAREVGLITPEEINNVASRVIERTDALAVRYGYLLP